MKPWMAIVIVVATLGAGLALMAPRHSEPQATGGAMGSAATNDKIAVISTGKRVEIAEHLKDGRFTIVEFTADW